jgi:predicted TIM-barrel fold metal-dependent hydrolase
MLFGRTGERNLDHPDFLPILEAAAALRAPLYIHPQTPALSVRQQYYSRFDEELNDRLATAGIGWHYETGIQILRLILSGILDRLPDLQFILGHWGETVLFFLDRIDMLSSTAKLNRPVSDCFRTKVSMTPGGILSERYLRWAIEVLGSDRILFATDYPYKTFRNGDARQFLQDASISNVDREKISCSNWDRLCNDIRRSSTS